MADALSRLGFGNDEEQFTQEDNITSPASLFSPQGSSPTVYVERLLDDKHFQGLPEERSCAISDI